MLLTVLFAGATLSFGQNFRGSIRGTVTRESGAVVAGAQVTAVSSATNSIYNTVTSSAGEYSFPNLPLGDYSVTVTADGFSTEKVNRVTVLAGVDYMLPVKLIEATEALENALLTEVTADALTLDTANDVQSTVIPETAVQNLPLSGRDFTQMVALLAGHAGYSPGGGSGEASSINGARPTSINWEIEGTDNNDMWWNIPAINQGGVNIIPGVLLPIDAINNFSLVTAGSIEIGRNPGGTVNLTIKSGANALHGTAYYFNHNEAFQANNPFTSAKPPTRDQHYGFTVGGPVRRNRTFYFVSGEHDAFLLGAASKATEPSAAYQAASLQVLEAYGVSENPVAENLLYGAGSLKGLWPAVALTGPAHPNNYSATGNLIGHSFNGILKLDEQLSTKDRLAFSWFIGQGTQVAPTSSALAPYFEDAPIHVQNYSLVYNRTLSAGLSNQLSAGVGYYNQAFYDADTSFDPVGLGLNTGVTEPSLAGAPHLIIGRSSAGNGIYSGSGFDPVGIEPRSGRNEITGHLNDDLNLTRGAHQFHFGGEFRQAQVDDFYQTGQRGTLFFDGSQGPWSSRNTACAALGNGQAPYTAGNAPSDGNLISLADFLAGCPDPAPSGIVLGNPKRQVFVNSFALYGQDTWQLNAKLSLNAGLRYDYLGPVHSDFPNLSIFAPRLATGLAVVGQDVKNLYPRFWGGVSPRVGFAWQLGSAGKTVLRGGYGFYPDTLLMKSILQNNDLQNISVFGPEYNPAGTEQVVQAAGMNAVLQQGAPVFVSWANALAGRTTVKISTFDQSFRPAYMQSFDLNIQHSFFSSVVAQVGYVGGKGTHLLSVADINPGALNSANLAVPYNSLTCPPVYSGATPAAAGNDLQCSRPWFSQFPNFSVIDELRSNLGSNYSSLQATLRMQNWHSLSALAGYTWSHALDYETGEMPYVAQNPLSEKDEYGNSDFDVRHTLSGYLDYQIPPLRGPSRLVKGWEISSGFSLHGGTPYTVLAGKQASGNGENADRAVQVLAHPGAGVSHAIVNGVVQWFSPSAFTDPPVGQYSPTRRGQNSNPGYQAVDISVFKDTPLLAHIRTLWRVDIFNLFNHTNLAPMGLPFANENGQITSTIGPYLGNPGIGPGEPVNAQFSLKILF
jgi:outer membrane receptor protein involved in Fe transport